MDFLPHPESGLEPLPVPFVANVPYIFGTDFWAHPELHGLYNNWKKLTPSELAPLVQSWLYFGVVAEVLGQNLELEPFRVSRQSSTGELEHFVNSKPLCSMLEKWLESKILPVLSPKIADLSSNSRGAASELRRLLSRHRVFLDRVVSIITDLEQL